MEVLCIMTHRKALLQADLRPDHPWCTLSDCLQRHKVHCMSTHAGFYVNIISTMPTAYEVSVLNGLGG